MNRRNFLRNASFAAGSLGILNLGYTSSPDIKETSNTFKLLYAPHFGMFKNSAGEDLIDQITFMYDTGFRAMEDNGMKGRSLADQEKIAKKMSSLDMKMGVFVAHTINWTETTLAGGNVEKRESFLREIKESVEVAKRVNAKWMTVVPGFLDLHQDIGFQTAHVVESLKRAAEILEPHGLVMVLEPLNFRDHPGLFLKKVPQAYEVCKAVDSPSCKILFDLYHQQIQEGNLIPNIDLAWDEIGYFQCGDNPGRKEPTTGEINYRNVFKHIYQKDKANIIVGMEHGNSIGGKEGEEAVIKAYREVDGF
ncbi:MAG: TIM barrel protein [Bacteroidales bacterium]|nr:TIM barrel protein [Bacteroidales bacterium]MCF8404087.1 TIM barrel protein [Bacteroidales bacterium]